MIESAGPVSGRERITELDVLRGIALLGVLLMNFVAFAGPGVMATKAQLASLDTASIDYWAKFATEWLVGDKANTVFATLFGLGFYLQMKRGEGQPGFEARYARRLFVLLLFGWLNATLLWVWDILHLYALAGFFLLLMRRWQTRSLVIFGAVAALYSDKMQDWLVDVAGLPSLLHWNPYDDAAVFERQRAAWAGDYSGLVANFSYWTWTEWIVGGTIIGWVIYALGRFALGAAIGRSGVLEDVRGHLPLLRRIARVALPAGLLLALLVSVIARKVWQPLGDQPGLVEFAGILRSPAALLLAAGYASGIVVALHGRGKRLFSQFAAVGRMALTNYLMQGLLHAFVLFRVGPGLGLAGRIGSFAVVLTCLAFFAFQMVFSHWWLARFRFGPMEWLWRTLTYGKAPPFRRVPAVAAAA